MGLQKNFCSLFELMEIGFPIEEIDREILSKKGRLMRQG
jgi:hypothetical protein